MRWVYKTTLTQSLLYLVFFLNEFLLQVIFVFKGKSLYFVEDTEGSFMLKVSIPL